MSTLAFLWPDWKTWWSKWARAAKNKLWIDASLIAVDDQVQLLRELINGTSDHSMGLIAYSHNFDRDSVPEVFKNLRLNARTLLPSGKQKLLPSQMLAQIRVWIQQCLIWTNETNIQDIETVYAHPTASKQMPWVFKELGIDLDMVEYCKSNGEAVEKALASGNPNIVAIGPEFACDEQQIILYKEEPKENERPRETSFALIANANNNISLPKIPHQEYGALIFPKIDEELWWDITIRSERMRRWVQIYSDRTSASPWSWATVAWLDVTSGSLEHIQSYIQALQTWEHTLRTKMVDGLLNWRWEWSSQRWVEEVQYLWESCPVIQV